MAKNVEIVLKLPRRIFHRTAKLLLISIGIYLAIALGLIASQSPGEITRSGGIDFTRQGENLPKNKNPLLQFQARDGAKLSYRGFPSDNPSAPLVIIIHGSGWHGGGYLNLASQLNTDLPANVLVPDLRGHGEKPQHRGDVAYIGQLEDDLADLIALHQKPGQKLIMLGHSSGGGLVIRFAGGAHGQLLDKAVLLAPFLKYNAPTTRPNSGGWAAPLTRRIIGLVMLNAVGITGLNGLTAIQFNFPDSVLDGPQGHTATDAYSFRLNASYAPRNDYLVDIAALPSFLLLVGSNDEAFIADQYEPLMSTVTRRGQYRLIEDASHLGVIDAPGTAEAIVNFLK